MKIVVPIGHLVVLLLVIFLIPFELLAVFPVPIQFEFFVEDWANHFPFDYPDTLKVGLAPFLEIEKAGNKTSRKLIVE